MARLKSELVSALGMSFEIFRALAEAVYSAGGNDNDLRRILKERQLRQQIAKLLVFNVDEVYALDVFGQSIDDLVKQGKYDWSSPDINSQNFKSDEMHQCELILRHFDKRMSTHAVSKALEKEDLRHADMSELLEFGSRYPEVQKQFPIIALGTIGLFHGSYLGVGVLDFHGGQRRLNLRYHDSDWSNLCRFAAVRKSAA